MIGYITFISIKPIIGDCGYSKCLIFPMSFLKRLFSWIPMEKELPKTCVYQPDVPEYLTDEFTLKLNRQKNYKKLYASQSTQATFDIIEYADTGVLVNCSQDIPERNKTVPKIILPPPSPRKNTRIITPKGDVPRISFQRTSSSTRQITSVQSRGFIYDLGLNEEKLEEKPTQAPEKPHFSFEIKKPKNPFESFGVDSAKSEQSSSPEPVKSDRNAIEITPIPPPKDDPIIIEDSPKYSSHFVISKKPSNLAASLFNSD